MSISSRQTRRKSKRARSIDVCDRLRGMIRSGEIAMGQRLKQLHVARRLNASQTPVREAIRTLEQEGWLISKFGKGTRVRELTPASINELYETRELLEGFLARKAASLLTAEQVASLRRLAEAADAIEQQSDPNNERPEKADVAFHLALAEMVGNGMILEVYQRLCNVGMLLVAIHPKIVPPNMRRPHGDLVDAIESGQGDWAEAVARRQMRLARDLVTQAVRAGLPARRVRSDGGYSGADHRDKEKPGGGSLPGKPQKAKRVEE